MKAAMISTLVIANISWVFPCLHQLNLPTHSQPCPGNSLACRLEGGFPGPQHAAAQRDIAWRKLRKETKQQGWISESSQHSAASLQQSHIQTWKPSQSTANPISCTTSPSAANPISCTNYIGIIGVLLPQRKMLAFVFFMLGQGGCGLLQLHPAVSSRIQLCSAAGQDRRRWPRPEPEPELSLPQLPLSPAGNTGGGVATEGTIVGTKVGAAIK